jgi:hypothetical protein
LSYCCKAASIIKKETGTARERRQTMAMSMSKISECDVTNCSYNVDKKCHTLGITVGDQSCARCDTYFDSGTKGGDLEVSGGVGACKTADCKFNTAFECSALAIKVGRHSGHADCETYTPR